MEPPRAALVVALVVLLGWVGSAVVPTGIATAPPGASASADEAVSSGASASSGATARSGAAALEPKPAVDAASAGSSAADGSGDAGTPTNDTTTTSADGTTTTAATTTVGNGTNATLPPPGVNRSGVEDLSALVTAHRDALNNTSFSFRFRANVSVGPASQWTAMCGTVETGLSPLVVHSESVRTVSGEKTSFGTDLWANGSTVVVRHSRENRTQLRRYNRSGGDLADETWAHLPRADLESQVTQAWLLELALRVGEYDLVRTERRDGHRVAVLRATEPVAAANLTDLNATVVVDARGRVHAVSLVAIYEGDEATHIEYRFELTEVGNVSVSRPRWVGAATPPNGTAANGTTTAPSGTTSVPTTTTTDSG